MSRSRTAAIGRRLARGVGVVWAAATLVFLLTSQLPGDGVRARLGLYASDAQVRAEQHRLGLDRPLPERYGSWLGGVLHGDFGTSYCAGSTPVLTLVGPAVRDSAVLAGCALAVLLPLATGLGLLAGLHPRGVADRVLLAATTTLTAVPLFVTAVVLALVLGLSWHWFPPLSLLDPGRPALGQPALLALPVLTLVLAATGYPTRLVRGATITANGSQWALAARLRGVPERVVVARHILPAVLPVLVQTAALGLVGLLTGVVVVEAVFDYPGVGRLLQDAVAGRDVPVVQAVAVAAAVLVVGANLTADLLVRLLVPRARSSW